MYNNKGSPYVANWPYPGRTSKLPPRSPLPNSSLVPTEFGPANGKIQLSSLKENRGQHQRASSESFVFEEQPSWLDDLLNEPETPVIRSTHRRSSSDSLAFLDFPGILSKVEAFSHHDGNFSGWLHSTVWESSAGASRKQNFVASHIERSENHVLEKSGEHSLKELLNSRDKSLGSSAASTVDPLEQKGQSEKKEPSQPKSPVSETDPKRAKQYFAQRSRVRKLQYIAELERNVRTLDVEGSEIATQFAFLKQQHLILSLENKALMQRITSIAHEKQKKYAQHELLKREVERLRRIYQSTTRKIQISKSMCRHRTNCRSHGAPKFPVWLLIPPFLRPRDNGLCNG